MTIGTNGSDARAKPEYETTSDDRLMEPMGAEGRLDALNVELRQHFEDTYAAGFEAAREMAARKVLAISDRGGDMKVWKGERPYVCEETTYRAIETLTPQQKDAPND